MGCLEPDPSAGLHRSGAAASAASFKAYDANHVIEALDKKHIRAVIPSTASRKTPRPIDRHLYKERHLVENFFCKIKRYRRVATRYEKTAVNYLGFVLFASIRVWLA